VRQRGTATRTVTPAARLHDACVVMTSDDDDDDDDDGDDDDDDDDDEAWAIFRFVISSGDAPPGRHEGGGNKTSPKPPTIMKYKTLNPFALPLSQQHTW
jgi:hypothetical protein